MKKLLVLFVAAIALATPSPAEMFDEAHRFIFSAVLEGSFEDGLSTEDAAQILMKRPNESYFHFIYSCPLCMPTIHALEVYRSRPAEFYGLKPGPKGTLGPGLKPVLKKQLYSEQPEERLTAINTLMQGWFARRMSSLALSDGQRAQLKKAIEEKRKEGMRFLEGSKQAKFERGDNAGKLQVLYYAPAYATLEECAVCNAACGKKLKMPEPQ